MSNTIKRNIFDNGIGEGHGEIKHHLQGLNGKLNRRSQQAIVIKRRKRQ